MMSIQSAAHALGGDVSGGAILCPGPGHSRHDRSLSVKFDPNAPDGFLVKSFCDDDFRDCRDFVKERLGIETDYQSHSHEDFQQSEAIKPMAPDPEKLNKKQSARKIWDGSRALVGTPAEDYLHGRGLVSPNSPSLRYNPTCPFKSKSVPAMIGAIVDIETNEFRGVHRTRLDAKEKAMLGIAAGAVVKLSANDEVTTALFLAEGIETTLAIMEMGFKPAWATLSAGSMAKFPVLNGIECLTIFADNDASGTGQRAAQKCGAQWVAADREVVIHGAPSVGTDFADFAKNREAA
ncbi:MAG: toprim domain-containing protein [Rhizobiaceae bacterium]